MSKSRRERRAYNEGKEQGYKEGYEKGLHDGNPFIAIAEAAAKVANTINDLLNDPDFIEACVEAQKENDALEIVKEDEDEDE